MNDNLFNIEPCPSPKLRWLERHQLTTRQTSAGWACELSAKTRGTGDTEEDAIADFCAKFKLKPHNAE